MKPSVEPDNQWQDEIEARFLSAEHRPSPKSTHSDLSNVISGVKATIDAMRLLATMGIGEEQRLVLLRAIRKQGGAVELTCNSEGLPVLKLHSNAQISEDPRQHGHYVERNKYLPPYYCLREKKGPDGLPNIDVIDAGWKNEFPGMNNTRLDDDLPSVKITPNGDLVMLDHHRIYAAKRVGMPILVKFYTGDVTFN